MRATVASEPDRQKETRPRSIAASAIRRSNRNCYELKIDVTRSNQRTVTGSNRNHQRESANARLTFPETGRSRFLIEMKRLETQISPFLPRASTFLIEKNRHFFEFARPTLSRFERPIPLPEYHCAKRLTCYNEDSLRPDRSRARRGKGILE